MATPNFDPKQYIDPASLAPAFQSKASIEEEMRNNKFNRLIQAVKTGQEIAGGMMDFAQKQQERKGLQKAREIMLEPAPQDGTAQTSTLGQVNTQPVDDRPQRLQEALLQATGDKGAMELLKAKTGARDGSRYQQSTMQTIGKDGLPRTVATTFDTTAGQHLDPRTMQPITEATDLSGLADKGYAQKRANAGYTIDGKEVIRDERTGAKFVIETDEKGQQTSVPYNDRIYPKLENPPATFTMAVAELGNAGQLLNTIVDSFDSKYVGPIAARAGKMTKFVDALSEEQRVAFYGNVAEYKNSIIKAITGAQMSEQEANRIIQQIPDENASPTAFLAGVKRAHMMTNRRISEMEKAIARSGGVVRGEGSSPISEEELTKKIDAKMGKIAKTGSTTSAVTREIDALANVLGLKKKSN